MLRKIVFVLVALALPFLAASAASAQQYPPSGDGTSVPADPSAGAGSSDDPAADDGADDTGAPTGDRLARTGTDVALLGGVAVVLVAGGAVAVVASRRRTGALA